MFAFIRSCAAAAAVTALCAACSTVPAYKALDPVVKQKVTATTGVIVSPQREIYATIFQAPAGSGGLIGAFIQASLDKHHTAEAEAGMVPLRNSLLNFNFDQVMETNLQQQLAGVDWLHMNSLSLIKDNSTPALDKAITGASTPYVLLVATDYHVSPNFNALIVSAHVTLFPRKAVPVIEHGEQMNKDAFDEKNALYTEKFVYRVDIPEDVLDKLTDQIDSADDAAEKQGKKVNSEIDDDQRAALQYWMQDNDKPIETALTAGMVELSRLISQNLTNGLPEMDASARKVKVNNTLGQTDNGTIIAQQGNGRVLLRLDDNSIESIELSSTEAVKVVSNHTTRSKTTGG
jgi:hypothetical protein